MRSVQIQLLAKITVSIRSDVISRCSGIVGVYDVLNLHELEVYDLFPPSVFEE